MGFSRLLKKEKRRKTERKLDIRVASIDCVKEKNIDVEKVDQLGA